MPEEIIPNETELVIDHTIAENTDSIYFKNNGEFMAITISESPNQEETSMIISKDAAKALHAWLKIQFNL